MACQLCNFCLYQANCFMQLIIWALTSDGLHLADKTCQPQQPTLSRSSSATSTNVPEICQLLQQPAQATREYVPAHHAIQPAQRSQVALRGQPREQQTSDLFVDEQQHGIPRHIHFTFSLIKNFNPPSVASITDIF